MFGQLAAFALCVTRHVAMVCCRANGVAICHVEFQASGMEAWKWGFARREWSELKAISGKVKLNLGGKANGHPKRRWEGWQVVDSQPKCEFGYRHVFPLPLPLPDESVDAIMTEHFLEHMKDRHVLQTLLECRRIIKPGGVLRLAVPDMNHPLNEIHRLTGVDRSPHHHSVWCVRKMGDALAAAGFGRVVPMHYWTHAGSESGDGAGYQFVERELDAAHGLIKRTPKHDRRNRKWLEWRDVHVTSLVMDAIR